MPIFTTTAELKDILGGSINASLDFDSIAPFFDIAHERHLELWLGTTMYADLVDGVENDDLTVAEEVLLPYYRKALAWLALLEYIPHASIQISEAGLYRVENDQYKTAYKYQQKAVEENARNNGYEAMEKLLLFLEANQDTYTGWPTALGYEKHHAVMLNTAANFRIVHNKKLSRYVFDLLRGIVEDVETFVLVPLLGQDQYDALLTARKESDWTSETLEKKLIYICNRATAHFALAEALRLNWVQLEGDRVTQREYLEEQGLPKEGVASTAGVATRLAAHDDTANRHIKVIRDFLTKNLDDDAFADYKAYQAEAAEAAEAARQAAACAPTGAGSCCDASERNDYGNAFGFGGSCGTPRKGISRL